MRNLSWTVILLFAAVGVLLAWGVMQLEPERRTAEADRPGPGRANVSIDDEGAGSRRSGGSAAGADGATSGAVDVPIQYRRVVSTSPGITELIYALGEGERLVAVTQYCQYPPEACLAPRIGGLYNPNLERLTALEPDLVVAQGRHEMIEAFCDREGIEFFSVGTLDALDDLPPVVMRLGRKLGARAGAEALVEEISGGLEQLRQAVVGMPRFKVFLTFGRTRGSLSQLYTCGPGSFLDDLLSLVGGDNVFGDASGAWPQASKEVLVKRAPEVILEVYAEALSAEQERGLRMDWQALPALPAVENQRIHYLSGDFIQIPGPRVLWTAALFARTLHPDLELPTMNESGE